VWQIPNHVNNQEAYNSIVLKETDSFLGFTAKIYKL